VSYYQNSKSVFVCKPKRRSHAFPVVDITEAWAQKHFAYAHNIRYVMLLCYKSEL